MLGWEEEMRKTKKSSNNNSSTSDSECCQHADADADADASSPKQLDDGFFEIETIRRKRLHKVINKINIVLLINSTLLWIYLLLFYLDAADDADTELIGWGPVPD